MVASSTPPSDSATTVRRQFVHHGSVERIDRVLARETQSFVPPLSRSRVQELIAKGLVAVDAVPVTKASAIVQPGAMVTLLLEESSTSTLLAGSIELPVLFEDEALLVIDKPCGISMHRGAGTRGATLVDLILASLAQRGWEDPSRPGIVHRLDKDTTGVVVVAKTPEVHAALAAQFATRTVQRSYQALVYGTPRHPVFLGEDEGIIDAPLARDVKDRRKMRVVRMPVPEGIKARRAVTSYHVEERMAYGALLRLKLHTGRTHQIRAHLRARHSPIIGDKLYGWDEKLPEPLRRKAVQFGRQALHAGELGFEHPIRKERLSFVAPLPTDMIELIRLFQGSVEPTSTR